MLGENKNLKNSLKDAEQKSLTSYGTGNPSYLLVALNNKANKLVTALYMVTDIMDKDEPLRNKLRTLGVEVLSDTHSPSRRNLAKNVGEILSFLNITLTIGMISEMNVNILKKEFTGLMQSIQESEKNFTLSDFFTEIEKENSTTLSSRLNLDKETKRQSVGIQKGNTLMKALKEIRVSDRIVKEGPSQNYKEPSFAVREERRDQIIKIIKDKKEEVSIKDIALALQSLGKETGEKTLQRELVSMVKDGVLNKTGEKRWSRYKLGSSN